MSLTVLLIIRDRPSHLQLAQSSFLGLAPLTSGDSATRVLVFDGPIQPLGAPAQLLGQKTAAPAAAAAPEPIPARLVAAATAPRQASLPKAAVDADDGAAAETYLGRLQ
jgi:hypothetical protein